MKKLLLAATALVFAVVVKAQAGADAVIKVNTERHDFGKILNAKPVDYFFEITNTSDKPVVIENAWGSCGCTTPEKPTEPIAPGATAKLKVNYNAAALGHFDKQVMIKVAGIDNPKIVTITGETLTQEAYDAYVKEEAAKPKSDVNTTSSGTQQPAKTKTKSSKNKSKSSGK